MGLRIDNVVLGNIVDHIHLVDDVSDLATNYLKLDLSNVPLTGTSLLWNGNAARDITLNRHTTSNTAGNSLIIRAGGATVGATDKNGGTLILSGGTSTGTSRGSINFNCAPGGSTGTTDNVPVLSAYLTNVGGYPWFALTDTATSTGSPFTNTTQFLMKGNAPGGLGLYRHTTADTEGSNLTIQAGGATLGATDKGGGSAVLRSGISTGNQGSNIYFQTYEGSNSGEVSTVTVNAAGMGYNVGDVLTIVGGNNDATYQVATITNGAIATVTKLTGGTGYGTSNAYPTTVSPSKTIFGGNVGLDGNDAFSAVDHADFKPTGNFSVGGWFKTSKTSASRQGIFQSYSSNTNHAGIILNLETDGKPIILSGKNTGTTNNVDSAYVKGSVALWDGAWHHLVGTWDGSKLHLYVDSVEVGTGTTWANAPAYAATNYVRIGCRNLAGTNADFMSGLLDDLFIMNGTALSAAQVATLYANELNTQATELALAAAYYRFESGALTTDTTAGAHTLTAISAPFEGPGGKLNVTAITGTTDNTASAKQTVYGNGAHLFNANVTSPSGTISVWNYSPVYTTPVSSSAALRTYNISGLIGATSAAIESYTGGIESIHQENDLRTSGLVAGITAIGVNTILTRTNSAPTTQVTTANGIYLTGYSHPTANTTSTTVGNLNGFTFNGSTATNYLTCGTMTGFSMLNPAAGTYTTVIGLDVAALTRADTNIGVRIATPSGGATANYALQLSGTGGTAAGGITFGTDTNLYRSAANTLKTDDIFFPLKLGIGASPTASKYLTVEITQNDPTTNYTLITSEYQMNTTVNVARTGYCGGFQMYADVADSTTNTGSGIGLSGLAFRKASAGAGTLTRLSGLYFQVGHPTSTASGATTTNAWGAWIQPYAYAGTITNFRGLFVDTIGGTASNITNGYGVYITPSTFMNYFAGDVGVGISVPTAKLHVVGDLRVESASESDMIFMDSDGDTSGALYLGGSTNGIKINKGGELTLIGTATVFDDLNFDPDSSGGPTVTLPDYVTINNVIHREFTSANNQLCGDGEELPHPYKLSTTLFPHIHLFLKSGESAGTTGVTFTFYWELRQSTGTTSGSVTLSATSAQLGTTAGGNVFTAYDSTGFAGSAELGGQLTVKIARTAGDAGDIVVTTYGVHYELDDMGSKDITTK